MILAISLLVCLFRTLTTAVPIANERGQLKLKSESEFPYIVSVQDKDVSAGEYVHLCGGTILSEWHILTAAHCLFDSNNQILKVNEVRVVAGAVYLNPCEGDEYDVEAFTVHKKYNPNKEIKWFEVFSKYCKLEKMINDIAIITLKSSITLKPGSVELVTLPSRDAKLADGTAAVVTGWGNTRHPSKLSHILLRVDVIIFSKEMCQERCLPVTDRQFCAGRVKNDKGSCQGDSGGPLVVNGVQRGIVSWAYFDECSKEILPASYTRVQHYLKWIRKNMQ